MYIKRIKEFINNEERSVIYNWVVNEYQNKRLVLWDGGFFMGGYKFGDPNNQNWSPSKLVPLKNIPSCFFEIEKRVANLFPNRILTKNSTAFANYFVNDSFIHPHKDSHIENCYHIRCNICIKKDNDGVLMIEDQKIPQDEKELIYFMADRYEHWVTNVHNERIILSYVNVVKECDIIDI